MRVTEGMRVASLIEGQARNAERLVSLSRQASSGIRVEKPSDDPSAWAAGVSHTGALGRLGARRDVAVQAQGDLELAESTLASASDLMSRVRELAVQAANGDADANSRKVTAKEVTQLRQALVGLANTRGASGYLFGGTATDTQPFDVNGAFLGNDGVIPLEIAEGVTTASNASGAKAFTAIGGRDILADLEAFQVALDANDDAGVQAAISAMDAGHTQLVGARVDAGLGVERFRSAAEVTKAASTLISQARADSIEADAVDVLSALTVARSAYERSLAVTREILSVSSLASG